MNKNLNPLERLHKNIRKHKAVKIVKTTWYTANLAQVATYLSNMWRSHRHNATELFWYVYGKKLDIMFIYEFIIAAKNIDNYKAAESIALLKRHTRHNINNITINEHTSFKFEPSEIN